MEESLEHWSLELQFGAKNPLIVKPSLSFPYLL